MPLCGMVKTTNIMNRDKRITILEYKLRDIAMMVNTALSELSMALSRTTECLVPGAPLVRTPYKAALKHQAKV